MKFRPGYHPSSDGPTSRQTTVLRCIADQLELKQVPPSVREIGQRLGIGSTNGVADHLKALEKKGCIERYPQTARGIRITSRGLSFLTGGGR